jgi:hypothetical protein
MPSACLARIAAIPCNTPSKASAARAASTYDRGRKVGTFDNLANRAIVCEPCNGDKGSRLLPGFLFRLSRAADHRAPFVAEFIQEIVNHGKHQPCPYLLADNRPLWWQSGLPQTTNTWFRPWLRMLASRTGLSWSTRFGND